MPKGSTISMTLVTDDQKAQQQVNRFFYNMEKQSRQATSRMGRLNQQFSKLGKDLKGYAMGAGIFGGIAAGAKGAVALVRSLNQELERAEQLMSQQTQGYSQLTQLADSKKEAQKYFRQADKTREEAGINAQRAGDFMFQLHSMGIADKRETLSKLIPVTKQGAAAQVGQGIGALESTFGKKQTGGTTALAGKIMSAAKYSPAGAGKIGKYVGRVGGYSKQIEATDEETMAALARVAKPMSGVEEAHTAVKAFTRELAAEGVSKGGIIENVERIKAKNLSNKELNERFGAEAAAGFVHMSANLPEIKQDVQRLKSVERRAGTEQGYIPQRLQDMPESAREQLEKRKQEQARQISLRQSYGAAETQRQTSVKGAKADINESELPLLSKMLAKKGVEGAGMIGGAVGAEPGTVAEGFTPTAKKAGDFVGDWMKGTGTGTAMRMFTAFFGEEQQKTRESVEKNTEAVKEAQRSTEENTQAMREKTTGETVPDEQTGAEPVNN